MYVDPLVADPGVSSLVAHTIASYPIVHSCVVRQDLSVINIDAVKQGNEDDLTSSTPLEDSQLLGELLERCRSGKAPPAA